VVFWFEGKVWLGADFLDYNEVVFATFRNAIKNDVFDLPNNFVQLLSCNVGRFVGRFYLAG
jgi:hypothetical protein